MTALPQEPQWTRWYAGAPLPQHALLVTFAAPLDSDPQLARAVASTFEHVTSQPPIALSYAGIHEDVYYVVQLDGARPNARDAIPGL